MVSDQGLEPWKSYDRGGLNPMRLPISPVGDFIFTLYHNSYCLSRTEQLWLCTALIFGAGPHTYLNQKGGDFNIW